MNWQSAPAQLDLAPAAVHVWSIEADVPDRELDSLRHLLSAQEAARAARFSFDKDRRLFIAAHGALRSILAGYLRTGPDNLAFAEGVNGKPYLTAPVAGLRFNLSHSRRRALLALSFGGEVGVDIEYVKPEFQFSDIAERFFTAQEAAALRALPADLQRQGFYQCWTAKEAFLKAKGTGLSGQLDEVEIILAAPDRVEIRAAVPGWTLNALAPLESYESALVVAGPPAAIRCYHWQP